MTRCSLIKSIWVILLLAQAAVFAVCGGDPADGENNPAGPTPSDAAVVVVDSATSGNSLAGLPTPTLALPADPSPSPVPLYSITTGRLLPEGFLYQPVMVILGNAPQVRPQTGLLQADIIYETASERDGNTTRLVCLFGDEIPAAVGPVESARCFDTKLWREWNGMFVYNGYPQETSYPEFDDEDILFPISYDQTLSPYFYSDKTVSSQQEHAIFCRLKDLTGAMFGSSNVIPVPHFNFAFDVSYAFGKPVDKIGIPFNGSDKGKIEFVYEPKDNRLYRYERNSKGTLTQSKTRTPSDDGLSLTTEPVSVQNLIVQYVRYPNLTGQYRDLLLTGTGECEFFINGQQVSGQWKHSGTDGTLRYYLNNGDPLVLQPGSTWIVLEPTKREIKVRYRSA